ncbi:hypothetical protein ACFYVK_20170 [Streptomyces chartreusis]|uniref:hypothetical protein n=1 Tax=Streptomyces chartreusis TaxID=1969 RepID=UPI0033F3C039
MGWFVAGPGWFDGVDGFDALGVRLLGVEGLELLGVPLFGVELRSGPVPVDVDGVAVFVFGLVDGGEVLDGVDGDGFD